MFANQYDLADFTPQTNHQEPNFSFHLANELWKYFSWLSCDFDITKIPSGKRPDVIFHRRGTNDFNLLVMEVKRLSHNNVNVRWICRKDESKIRDLWFSAPLNYPFGLSVVVDEKSFEFAFAMFRKNPAMIGRFYSIKFREPGFPDDSAIIPLVEQMIVAKRNNPEANTDDLETTINDLVFPLYA